MVVKIDPETGQIFVNNTLVYSHDEEQNKTTLADLMAIHRGEKEYSGIVGAIQEWYYGKLVEASWCATGLSYFANVLGVLDKIGGKNENVYWMMKACERVGKGTFYTRSNLPNKIEKGDILFWLWEGNEMTATSKKHVGVAEYVSTGNEIFCIGCNQKDKICTLKYDRKFLYSVFRME